MAIEPAVIVIGIFSIVACAFAAHAMGYAEGLERAAEIIEEYEEKRGEPYEWNFFTGAGEVAEEGAAGIGGCDDEDLLQTGQHHPGDTARGSGSGEADRGSDGSER